MFDCRLGAVGELNCEAAHTETTVGRVPRRRLRPREGRGGRELLSGVDWKTISRSNLTGPSTGYVSASRLRCRDQVPDTGRGFPPSKRANDDVTIVPAAGRFVMPTLLCIEVVICHMTTAFFCLSLKTQTSIIQDDGLDFKGGAPTTVTHDP